MHGLTAFARNLAIFFLVCAVSPLAAQFAQRSALSGFVTDPSGAAVVGAQVALTDVDRGVVVKSVTDGNGHYEFNQLTIGKYKVTVESKGFKKAEGDILTVGTQAALRYDVALSLGGTDQTVVVSSAEPLIQTDRVSVGETVDQEQVENVPINGRNYTSLAALVPAVSTSPRANINPGGTYDVGASFTAGGVQYSAGGVVEGSRDNGFYINGVNANENYDSSISYAPSAEAISEVKISVADFSAANGHDITTFNVSTKGGTNSFHGSVYDYLENDAFNALSPYAKEQALSQGLVPSKPFLRSNQYGGNFGGPVDIPHLVHLKDRAFFFVNYERFPLKVGGGDQFALVPSDAERTGDFSALLAGPNPQQLYNPYTTVYNGDGTYTRQPIPGNRLDLATQPGGAPLIDPASAAIIALYPHANTTPSAANPDNYLYSSVQGYTTYHFDSRFDYRITNKNSVFVTYSQYHGTQDNTGGVFPNYVGNVDDGSHLITVNDAHSFSPTLTNEFIFAIGTGALITNSPSQLAYLNSSANPFNSLFQNTGSGLTHGVLALNVFGYASPGFNQVFRAKNRTFQLSDNVTKVWNRHTISVGLDYLRKGEYDWDFIRFVNFGESAGTLFTASGSDIGSTPGDGIADLLLGLPDLIHQRYDFGGGNDPLAPELNVVVPSWGAYVSDRFQINSKLTITYGIRYDLNIPIYALNNLCCAIYRPDSSGGTLALPGLAPGLSNHPLSADKNNFAPRFSFAYQVMPKTVVRAGFGVFYNGGSSEISGAVGNALNGVPGYFTGDELTNARLGVPNAIPALHLSNVFQTEPPLTAGEYPVSTGTGQGYFGDDALQTIYYFDNKSMTTPYYLRESMDIQRELTPNTVLTVSYVGAQGRKGSFYVDINVPAYQTGWVTQDAFDAARPNNSGRFGDIYLQRPGLNSSYNAGVVKIEKRMSHGLLFTTHYTYGKTISDRGLNGQFTVPNGYNYPLSVLPNRGEATLSHRHRFVFSPVYAPVYGQDWSRPLKLAFSDWRISAIVTLESGDALSVYNDQTTANDYAGPDQLSVTGNPNFSPGNRSFAEYFNTAAFTAPPTNTRGNAGPGIVRGPGQNNWDISIGKNFPIINERLHGELRGDFFNAFNHTQWNAVSTTYPVDPNTDVPFGQVEGSREGRIVQLGFKVMF